MIHRVKCRSGIAGWKARLQDSYNGSFESFKSHCEVYGIAERLGYDTPEKAWEENLYIQGSIMPSDLEISPRQDVTDVLRDRSEYSYGSEYPR